MRACMQVTPETLFRGSYEGCAVGPHVSQFLLQDIQLGHQNISQVSDTPSIWISSTLLAIPKHTAFVYSFSLGSAVDGDVDPVQCR